MIGITSGLCEETAGYTPVALGGSRTVAVSAAVVAYYQSSMFTVELGDSTSSSMN